METIARKSACVLFWLAAAFLTSCSPPEIAHTSAPSPTPTPHPATGAIEAATRLYPDLGKLDSTFNKTFRDLYAERKQSDPEFLTKADWPLKLARETGAILGVAEYSPAPKPAVSTPTPTWLQQRLQERPNALDEPAREAGRVLSNSYWTDQYGNKHYDQSYWVDQYGYRHYY